MYQGSVPVSELNELSQICRSWCRPSSWRCVLPGQNWQRSFKFPKSFRLCMMQPPVLRNRSGSLNTFACPNHMPESLWKRNSSSSHHAPQIRRAASLIWIWYDMLIPDNDEPTPSYCLAFVTTKICEELLYGKLVPLKFALASLSTHSCFLFGVAGHMSSAMRTPFLSIHEVNLCVCNVLQMFLFSGLILLHRLLAWMCGGISAWDVIVGCHMRRAQATCHIR